MSGIPGKAEGVDGNMEHNIGKTKVNLNQNNSNMNTQWAFFCFFLEPFRGEGYVW